MLKAHWINAKIPDNTCFFAFTDVHGHAAALRQALNIVQQTAMQRAYASTQIEVISLGDHVDRGSNSKGVIQQLIDFDDWCQESHPSIKLTTLQGNHCTYPKLVLANRLSQKGINHWLGVSGYDVGGSKTLKSYLPVENIKGEHAQVWADLMRKEYPRHVEFLNKLKMYYQIGEYVFVHGGVNSNFTWQEQLDKPVSFSGHLDLPEIGGMLLSTRPRDMQLPFLEHNLPPGGKVVVHGHSPSKISAEFEGTKIIIPDAQGQLIDIDTDIYKPFKSSELKGGLTCFWRYRDQAGFIRISPDGRDILHYKMDKYGKLLPNSLKRPGLVGHQVFDI